jgi:PEP-CTERM motif-containing protein
MNAAHTTKGSRCDTWQSGGLRKLVFGTAALSALGLTIAGHSAKAQNLVQNGTFSQALIGGAPAAALGAEFGDTNNGFTPAQQLAGWTTAGYNFVFLPGTVDTSGSTGQYTPLKLWGPNNGGTNAALLPQASPTGGNYVGADGAFEVSAITQTVTGLHVGQKVAVSFAWAGAQQSGFTGPTTDQWTVSLGTVGTANPSQSTSVVSLQTEGATAWMNQTFTFVATSSSELLSFLATGTPAGQPPFALLANVSVTNVPEPASLLVILSGIVGMVGFARRRQVR